MYYQILGEPMSDNVPGYKGLYRCEAYLYPDLMSNDVMELALKYVDCGDDIGITSQLSIAELEKLTVWLKNNIGRQYSLVSFCLASEQEHPEGVYYGVDVAHHGHYSWLGDGVLQMYKGDSGIVEVVREFFLARLNQHLLFSCPDDACLFSRVLTELESALPGQFEEGMTWDQYAVYALIE